MTLSSIAHKLRALRAKAEDAGSPQPERDSAMAKYEQLLRKYHLDASELELREEGTRLCVVNLGARGNQMHIAKYLGNSLAKFTKCKVWGNYRLGTMNFLGLASDAEFAEWLLRSLVSHCQGEALAFSMEATPGDLFKGDVEAFVASAAQRISQRLKALMQAEPQGTSLVVVRSRMIDEAFNALGLNLGRARNIAISGRENAMSAGREAGDRASFARPLSQGQTLRLGKV